MSKETNDKRVRESVMACRVTEGDRARVQVAAQLAGRTASAYIARAAVRAADRDLERLTGRSGAEPEASKGRS